jgi:hypothetical protein
MAIPSVNKARERTIFDPPPRQREPVEKPTNFIGVVLHTKRRQYRAFIGSKTIGWYDEPILAAIDHDREARKRNKPTNFG